MLTYVLAAFALMLSAASYKAEKSILIAYPDYHSNNNQIKYVFGVDDLLYKDGSHEHLISIINRQASKSLSVIRAVLLLLQNLFSNFKEFVRIWAEVVRVEDPYSVADFISRFIKLLRNLIRDELESIRWFNFKGLLRFTLQFVSSVMAAWNDFLEGWKKMIALDVGKIATLFQNGAAVLVKLIIVLGVDIYEIVKTVRGTNSQ